DVGKKKKFIYDVGYVYGFLFGFAIAFSSALAGSIVCFYFCRRRFKAQVRELMARNKNLKGVVRTVEKRGFRLLVLIRLAPYPFNIMNALLSATHIPLHTYALATAISLLKLTLHVYIGSTLSSLTEGDDDGGQDDGSGEPKNPNSGHGKAVKIIVMILGVILGIGVGGYVYLVAKREIALAEANRMERRRRRRRESLRRALDEHEAASSLGSSTNGRMELSEGSFLDRERDLLSASSDVVVGGYNVGYHEDEDEDGHEHQSLFVGRDRQRQQNQQRQGDWRNVGANVDSSTESDEDSDFLDDDDDDNDDDGDGDGEERLIGLGSRRVYLDEDEDENENDVHNRPREEYRAEEEEDEGEALALDFSAHHAGLMDSPWQDEEPAPSISK
ncbi:snare associated Golgi protein-domain-containing protein, partial [Dissophora ornata]